MLRRLLTPKWLGALALAILFAVAAYHLGWWQYGRHVAKVERNARLDANYAATPRPLREVVGIEPLPIARQWTHVTATGEYAGTVQLYVRNRPNLGSYGYEVVAPFVLSSGEVVLVDRGWVENSARGASVLPPVAPVPEGTVTLTGWALPSEPSLGRSLPAGQLASINLGEAAAGTGQSLLGGFVRLEQERTHAGAVAARPQALEPPDRSLGPHQAYAWNWWLMVPLGFVLMGFRIRAELATEADADPRRQQVPTTRPAKAAKKTRIWDDEDA